MGKKSKTWLWILSVLLSIGMLGNAMKSPEEKAKIAATKEARKAQDAEESAIKVAQKAAEDRAAKEAAALELEVQSECEGAVRKRLDIPKSADFSIMKSRLSFDGLQPVHYNTFTYRNRFNAELEAAYLCHVDAAKFKDTGSVKVVGIKIGKP